MKLFPLFLYSMWHIFLPGESTPIFVALRVLGIGRVKLLKTGVGLAISNGGIMVIALWLGASLSQALEERLLFLDLFVRSLGIAAFVLAAGYVLWRARAPGGRRASTAATPRKRLLARYPFATGLVLGLLPSPADVGYLFIGSALAQRGIGLWLAVGTTWLGVLVSFSLLGAAVGFVPIERLNTRFEAASEYVCILTAVLLLGMALWLGWTVWTDYAGMALK